MNQFLRDIVRVALGAFFVWMPVFYFNVVQNHYGVFPWKNEKIKIELNKRFVKVQHLIDNPEKHPSLLFGSSRVNFVNSNMMSEDNYYNMTYAAGVCKQHLEDITYLLKNGVNIKNIMIGLDQMSLVDTPPDNPGNELFKLKYPETWSQKLSFYKKYIFTIPSKDQIKDSQRDDYLDYNTLLETGILVYPDENLIQNNLEVSLQRQTYMQPTLGYSDKTDIDANMKIIHDLIQLAKKNHIHIRFFINPIHHKTFINLDVQAYLTSLKRLSELTPFYDFSGLNSVNIENANYLETSHFNRAVGTYMIQKMEGKENNLPPDFGFYVTEENIDLHIKRQISWLEDYYKVQEKKLSFSPNIIPLPSSPKTQKTGIDPEYINQYRMLEDTLLISAPYIKIKIKLRENWDKSTLCIQVGDKLLYAGDWIKEEKETSTEDFSDAILVIPSHIIGVGIHKMALAAKISSDWNYSKPFYIHIIGNDKEHTQAPPVTSAKNVEWLLDKKEEKDLYPLSNGQVRKIFTLRGWAINTTDQKSCGGILADVNGYQFRSQLIYERRDIVSKHNNENYNYSGWQVQIPDFAFCEGQNNVWITIVDEKNQVIFKETRAIEIPYYPSPNFDHLEDMKHDEVEAASFIDLLNQTLIKKENTILKTGGNPVISGWAFDSKSKKPGSKVILMIGERQFVCDYGIEREDLAKAFNNTAVIPSGWQAEVPIQSISSGRYPLKVAVISADGKYYQLSKESVFLTIK